jgi:hypothetical protein
MNTYIGMKSGIQEKFQEIYQDLLIDNVNDLSNRQEYFTRKYRGNRLNDVNVGIWSIPHSAHIVQIFVRNKDGYKREQFKVVKLSSNETKVISLGYGR